MILKSLLVLFVLTLFNSISYAQRSLKTGDSIQITQLKEILIGLPKTFKGFSIASGADDNICLNSDGKKIEISYRQESTEEAGWFAKLQDFAINSGYEIKVTDSPDPKTVPSGKPLQLPTVSFKEKDRETVYELVRGIMLSVFRNGKDKYYQVTMPE